MEDAESVSIKQNRWTVYSEVYVGNKGVLLQRIYCSRRENGLTPLKHISYHGISHMIQHGKMIRYINTYTCMYSHIAEWMIYVKIDQCPLFSCDQAALRTLLSVCLSVRPSVRLSHLFHYVPTVVSSWNFQALLPMADVMSMQKVKVRGQRSQSQRSWPNLAVSGL